MKKPTMLQTNRLKRISTKKLRRLQTPGGGFVHHFWRGVVHFEGGWLGGGVGGVVGVWRKLPSCLLLQRLQDELMV